MNKFQTNRFTVDLKSTNNKENDAVATCSRVATTGLYVSLHVIPLLDKFPLVCCYKGKPI